MNFLILQAKIAIKHPVLMKYTFKIMSVII